MSFCDLLSHFKFPRKSVCHMLFSPEGRAMEEVEMKEEEEEEEETE